MSLTLEDIDALLRGERDSIWVGEMPLNVALSLGLAHPNVYMSRERIGHIFERHRDITRFMLLHLPFAIRHGLLIRETRKPECILASYQAADPNRCYIAALKLLSRDCEVWLSSFYRGNIRKTRALIRRGEILKTHD
jgi:hypothetical protein